MPDAHRPKYAPAQANAELTVPGGDLREQPGLTVHRDLLASDEIIDFGGVPVTTVLRMAWDLVRWLPTVEAVVALDALARLGGFAPQAVPPLHRPRHPPHPRHHSSPDPRSPLPPLPALSVVYKKPPNVKRPPPNQVWR